MLILSNLKSLEDEINTSQYRTLASLLSFSERLGWHTPNLITGLKVGHSGGVTVHPISLVADLIAGTHPRPGGFPFWVVSKWRACRKRRLEKLWLFGKKYPLPPGSSSGSHPKRKPPGWEAFFFLSFFGVHSEYLSITGLCLFLGLKADGESRGPG